MQRNTIDIRILVHPDFGSKYNLRGGFAANLGVVICEHHARFR
jgi:hypothetical protein